MKLVEEELKLLKKYLRGNIIDLLPDNALVNFVLEGSKFIRSTIVILYLKAQGVGIQPDLYKIFSSGEILHSASLLHDDVIDEAESRRGKITLAKEYDFKISILAGDYLLSCAIENLLALNNLEVLDKFKTCMKKMVEAEIKQYFYRGKISSEQEYIGICRDKTALLFSTILEASAQMVKLDITKAKLFGDYFGLCFQIKNDLNDESAIVDKKNGIYTANDVLGIEKTGNLLDNYKEEMRKLIKDFPENIYKKGLEGLIDSL